MSEICKESFVKIDIQIGFSLSFLLLFPFPLELLIPFRAVRKGLCSVSELIVIDLPESSLLLRSRIHLVENHINRFNTRTEINYIHARNGIGAISRTSLLVIEAN